MKKFFAILLTFAMLFSLAMPAMAAEGDTYTFYIDISQVDDSSKEVSGVFLWDNSSEVYNEQMTHVSGSVYSYPLTSSTPAGSIAIFYADNTPPNYYNFTSTDATKNLYTPTDDWDGTWSVYGDDGSAGLPSAPSDGGNANDTIDVTASYTPSSTEPTDPEAKWGTSKDELTGSGTLAQAIDAAEANPSITYIQLQRNVTTDNGYDIESGVFTIDLNGKTLTSSGYFINVLTSAAQVTLTDTPTGGAVTTTGSGCAAIIASSGGKVVINGGSYSGEYAIYLDEGSYAEINNGTFAGTSNYAVMTELNSELNIAGGNFSGSMTAISAKGTTTITGGSFMAGSMGQIAYWNGTLDLSDYTGDDLTLSQFTGADMTVPNENIKLPEGYVFKDSDGNTVDTLANGTIYTIANETSVPTYDIITVGNLNGTVTVMVDGIAVANAAEGETVTVTFTPNEGYVLFGKDAYELNNGSNPVELTPSTDTNTYTFTMPAYNVQVEGQFAKNGKARDDLYFNNGGNTDWTNVYAYFCTDTGSYIAEVLLTMAGDGVYTLPEGTVIPNLTYRVYFSCQGVTADTVNVEIPIGKENMFTLGTTTNEDDCYEGTWSIYTPSQPPVETTSAEITWGSMSFTYDDTIDETTNAEKGWTPADEAGAGTVTVTNTGDTTITAQVAYTAVDEYAEIEGEFDAASAELAAEASKTFTLTLKNKPAKAIPAGTKIGSVTITIEEYTPVSLNVSFANTENYPKSWHIVRFYDADGTQLSATEQNNSATETVTVPANAAQFDVQVKWHNPSRPLMDVNPRATAKTDVPAVTSNVVVTITNSTPGISVTAE